MRGDLKKARRAEVADLEQTFVRDEDVRGSQVAMDDALTVRVFDGIQDLTRVIEHEIQLEGAAIRDDRLERLARDVLHHDEKDVVLLFCRDDGDDVRMVERREQPRLAQELTEVESLAVRHLHRDALADPRILCG